MLLRHYANAMLLYKYYDHVSTKVFKIAMKKKNNKKEEIIRLHLESLTLIRVGFVGVRFEVRWGVKLPPPLSKTR